MNQLNTCVTEKDSSEGQTIAHCTICNKELDYLTSLVSENPEDAIYICFESIKQKIFVYGKYLGGSYGAIEYSKYYTKDECAKKKCESDIQTMLDAQKKDEYSRLITCKRGNMESIILTRDIINQRKTDLLAGRLDGIFKNPNSEKKYYCHDHASSTGFKCQCGEDLVKLGSEKHRDLTGMEDRKFIAAYIPEIMLK
jgi:hypothetical protein